MSPEGRKHPRIAERFLVPVSSVHDPLLIELASIENLSVSGWRLATKRPCGPDGGEMTARVQKNFCQHPGHKAHVRILKCNLRFINRSVWQNARLDALLPATRGSRRRLKRRCLTGSSREGLGVETEVPCAVVILRKCERMIRSTV